MQEQLIWLSMLQLTSQTGRPSFSLDATSRPQTVVGASPHQCILAFTVGLSRGAVSLADSFSRTSYNQRRCEQAESRLQGTRLGLEEQRGERVKARPPLKGELLK